MAHLCSAPNKKLQAVKITEIFEDGSAADFNELLISQEIDIRSLCLLRDHDKRTPLHLVCMKGHIEVFEKLLPLYIEHKLDLDLLDENGDTPLLLACSHGSNNNLDIDFSENINDVELDQTTINNHNRHKMVLNLIKNGAILRKSIKRRKNNPLHWAVYYGDYDTGIAVFNEYPLIILKRNNSLYGPLEIVFHENLKKRLAKNATKLVKTIVNNFSLALFNNDEEFVLRNADPKETKKFLTIKKLRANATAYNTVKLLENIAHVKNINIIPEMTQVTALQPVTIVKEQQVSIKETTSFQNFNFNKNLVLKNKTANPQHNNKIANVRVDDILSKGIQDHFNDSYHNDSVSTDKERKVVIYDDKQNFLVKNKYLIFLHKMLLFAIHVEDINIIRLLIDSFMLSPFVSTINGLTALHYACTRENSKIVEILLDFNYKYYNSRRTFSIMDHINKGATDDHNTCVHLAVKYAQVKNFEILHKHGGNVFKFNYQDWKPLDMSKKSYFVQRELQIMDEIENKNLMSFNDLHKVDSWNPQKIAFIKEEYQYIIIAKDTNNDYTQSLVFKQLELLRITFLDKIKIKYMKPMNHKMKDHFRFYFLINVEEELLDSIADYLNFSLYNTKQDYVTEFTVEKSKQFSKFRDFHIHAIINFLLSREFNLNHYIKQGIIEAAFPLHEFIIRNNIDKNWKKEQSSIFFDPWKLKQSSEDLRPFNSIAYYFGCDISLYISFTTMYTSYLIFLAFIGAAVYIWVLVSKTSLDNFITPIFAFLISLWVTYTYEKWRQRESEHAFIWNTSEFKLNEQPRIDYLGNYVIDPINKNVVKEDPFPTYKRRCIVS